MIKFRAEGKGGRPLIGLGLSSRNIALLQQGKPIFVDGQELGLDIDVMIWAGETEEAMAAEFRERGVKVI